MPEGRQSPPPERQTGRQIDPPASGQGADDAQNKEQTNKEQLKNLSSNPTAPMDAHLEEKFAKKEGN